MSDEWVKSEPLGIPIIPPYVNGPENRSKKNLQMVLDQFPLDHERYRARDVTGDLHPETFCNFFTRDVARAMSAPLPEGMTANSIHHALINGAVQEYRRVAEVEAAWCVELGQFVMAIAENDKGPGHMVPCREVTREGMMVCDHVGTHNARRISVGIAFGPLYGKIEYWVHK